VGEVVLPKAPALTATESGSEIQLSWTNVDSENGYILFRSVDEGDFAQLTATAADVVTYSDTDLIKESKYMYFVYAYNDQGNSANSDTATVFTSSENTSTEISEFNIVIYPNPALDIINVQTESMIQQVEIYSSVGTLIKQQNISANRATLNIEDLKSGIYIIQIRYNSSIVNKTIVIN
jgi:hypothetical protein